MPTPPHHWSCPPALKKSEALSILGFANSSQGMSDAYCWADGKQIHYTSTCHMRRLLKAPPLTLHKSVLKWERAVAWDPKPDII